MELYLSVTHVGTLLNDSYNLKVLNLVTRACSKIAHSILKNFKTDIAIPHKLFWLAFPLKLVVNDAQKILHVFLWVIENLLITLGFILTVGAVVGMALIDQFNEIADDPTDFQPNLPGGIHQAGNTCYFASLLQCFIAAGYTEYLKVDDDDKAGVIKTSMLQIEDKVKKSEAVKGDEVRDLITLVNGFYKPSNSTDSIPKEVSSNDGKERFQIGSQHCVEEAFEHLCEILKIPHHEFQFSYHYAKESENLGLEEPPTKKSILSLPLVENSHPKLSLQELVNSHPCNGFTDLTDTPITLDETKQLIRINQLVIPPDTEGKPDVSKINKILPLKLVRFNDKGEKINTPVSIDQELLIPIQNSTAKAKYKLVAASCHAGAISSRGHYITIAQHMIQGKKAWVKCDDADVRLSNESDAFEQLGKDGYLFFYAFESITN